MLMANGMNNKEQSTKHPTKTRDPRSGEEPLVRLNKCLPDVALGSRETAAGPVVFTWAPIRADGGGGCFAQPPRSSSNKLSGSVPSLAAILAAISGWVSRSLEFKWATLILSFSFGSRAAGSRRNFHLRR